MYDVYVIKDATNTVIYVGVTKVSKGYLTRFEEHKVASKILQVKAGPLYILV